jgi:hypothetical protein
VACPPMSSCSHSQIVFPRNPVHLGQAILRSEAGSALRPGFLRSKGYSSSLAFRLHHSQLVYKVYEAGPMAGVYCGDSGPSGPGLCKMLDANFREHPF